MQMIFMRSIFLLSFVFLATWIQAQVMIKGVVIDQEVGEPLIGAGVIIDGTTIGTITDWDGKYAFEVQQLPVNLEVSFVGYETLKIEINSTEETRIELGTNAEVVQTIEVKERRVSEKQQQNAQTVESMDLIAIKETPAANFYDGLGALKDVDLTAASLGFKIINTRGFNSTSPVRSLQLIDGVDNQSPGLNFSLGNFLGASELDVNKVEIIVGASGAFYGPNAFNGVIAMGTKDPFFHEGLAVSLKTGERALFEGGLRWAQAIKNSAGHKWFAYKINGYYLQANDWEAENYDAVFDSPSPVTNPGGYDAVNVYGDEYQLQNEVDNPIVAPGLGKFYRTGFKETDLVDYDSKNTKLSAAFHFRLKPSLDYESPELLFSTSYGGGTTVYQGDNRFSLRDIKFYQHKIELKKRDNYFVRSYLTHEDAGNSYDPYFTAILLSQRGKSDADWSSSYINYWSQQVTPQIRAMEGYPQISDFPGQPDAYRAAQAAFLSTINSQIIEFHEAARILADGPNALQGNPGRLVPGSDAFKAAFDEITSTISSDDELDGTRFYDKSMLYHIHGEKTFKSVVKDGTFANNLDFVVGGNYRKYLPNSKGSILLDTNSRKIDTYEYGLYGGGILSTLNNKLKISVTARLDKHENFDYLFSPAASMVYTKGSMVLRASFSSAIRNPTLTEQYLNYNVGRAILVGNIDGVNDLITVESFGNYLNTFNADTLDYFNLPAIQPEKVKTIEFGIRESLWESVFVDIGYYFNWYDDFLGYRIGVKSEFNPLNGFPIGTQAYRASANAIDKVTTQGFSAGINYYFWNYYALNGNYSFNQLNTSSDDPVIPAYNTPRNKFNLGFSARQIPMKMGGQGNTIGFSVNYKWVQGFLFEGSPQFTGNIDSYGLLDGQINFNIDKWNASIKVGASNLLNNEHYETYGGPIIKRLAYISLLYDWRKKQ